MTKRILEFAALDNRPMCTIELNLDETMPDKPKFRACGDISHGGCGQCINGIAELYPENALVQEIAELWRKYHLNDMHADCVHNINEKAADKIIVINKYSLNSETYEKQKAIKDAAIKALEEGKTVRLSQYERDILALPFYKTDKNMTDDVRKYYKIDSTKREAARWVNCVDHDDGVLCKPCPVCGYRFGTAWVYHEIPAKDLARIREIIATGK